MGVHDSLVCLMEVHSSSFVSTVKKLVLGLVELLHIAKAHGLIKCSMVGFALPKVGIKQSIVKMEVEYLPDLIVYYYMPSFTPS